jgi:HSP20 family protein
MAHIYLERRAVPPMDEELKTLFERLHERTEGREPRGECTPPMDVVETARAVELVMDLPGVALESITVLFVRNTLVVAGTKVLSRCAHGRATFHLAQRTFGRFARGVRLAGAFDAGQAAATLRGGELRVTLPRLDERRGTELRIPVRTD